MQIGTRQDMQFVLTKPKSNSIDVALRTNNNRYIFIFDYLILTD